MTHNVDLWLYLTGFRVQHWPEWAQSEAMPTDMQVLQGEAVFEQEDGVGSTVKTVQGWKHLCLTFCKSTVPTVMHQC